MQALEEALAISEMRYSEKPVFNKDLKKCSVRKHKNQDKLPLFLDGFRLNVKSVIKIAVVISMAVIATLYLASVLLF